MEKSIARLSTAEYLNHLDCIYEILHTLFEDLDNPTPDTIDNAGSQLALLLLDMYAHIRHYPFSNDASCKPYTELLEVLEDSYQHHLPEANA